MLVYPEMEANNFIAKHFPKANNKPEIKEYFLFVWNDSNLQNAKVLTLHTFTPLNNNVMNQLDRKLKNETLEQVYKIAKERGYKVYTFESNHSNTINQIFIENQKGQIGTVSDYYSGLRFGTVHKPTVGIGTGFGIGEEFENPENLDLIFSHSPNWAKSQDREKVKKYSSWNEYISKETILKYYEL